MTRAAAWGVLLAAASLAAACSGPGPLAAPSPEAASGQDAATADAAPATGDDGSAEAGAPVARCGSAGDGGQGATNVICPDGGCLNANWAQWPMPSSSVDVAGGAPSPQAYTANGDGTVTDDVTGLVWQQIAPANAYTWGDAQAYCAGLALAGHADWRVPAFIELVSIVDYARNSPAIDLAAFAGAPPMDYWASTPFAGALTDAREVYFSSGDTGHDDELGTNDVRCVRGPDRASSPAVPPGRYAVGADGVHDTKTGLTWQRAVSTQALAWDAARSYCAGLDAGAGGGWRLPTVKELLTLVDVTRATAPEIDCDAFPEAAADEEWSATPFAGTSTNAWGVYFGEGYPISLDVGMEKVVRCVR